MDAKHDKPGEVPIKDQLGHLVHPKNLLKTVASIVPGASACVEMWNQIDGQRVEKRLTSLEENEVNVLAEIRRLEKAAGAAASPPNINEWPAAVHEYLTRNVEFAVVHTPPDEPGHEFILPVANGCLVGDDYVLTCSEALDLAQDVADHKGGHLIILVGLCWYEFAVEPADEHSGLVLCKLTKRDEERFRRTRRKFEGLDLWAEPPLKKAPNSTITPWIGQEVGFILASDSTDNQRQMQLTHVEFCVSVISHFRRPTDTVFKCFVTSPVTARIRQVGSAAFSREGTLLGIICGVEKYDFDAGRRAVVKSLLGVPRFMEAYRKSRKL